MNGIGAGNLPDTLKCKEEEKMKIWYVRWKDEKGKYEEEFTGEQAEIEARKYSSKIHDYKIKEVTGSVYGSVVGIFPSMKTTPCILA
jgi:hypothetical protein